MRKFYKNTKGSSVSYKKIDNASTHKNKPYNSHNSICNKANNGQAPCLKQL